MANLGRREKIEDQQQFLHVEVVSPHEMLYTGVATMVIVPAEMGAVGIMPRHTPLLTRVGIGSIRVKVPDEEEVWIFVSGGLLEVQPHYVTVLADTALRVEEIDAAAAREAAREAKRIMAEQAADFDYAMARLVLDRSVAQLRTLDELRHAGQRSRKILDRTK